MTDSLDIKRIINEHYEKFYTQFVTQIKWINCEKHNLPKFTHIKQMI